MFACAKGRSLLPLTLLGTLALGFCVGCNRAPSDEQRLEEEYQRSGIQRIAVYPLAGRVTVDGEPLSFKSKKAAILVMAFDASKPQVSAKGQRYVEVKSDGSFDFGAGLPPGKYVMLFVALQHNKKKGWHGTDTLKNLYNDPNVNAKKPQFNIDHQATGKSDYLFNLDLSGQEAVATPGQQALTQLPD
jgi:hypothetical protein